MSAEIDNVSRGTSVKLCSRCRAELPEGVTGRYCRPCRASYMRQRRSANIEMTVTAAEREAILLFRAGPRGRHARDVSTPSGTPDNLQRRP